MGRRNLRRTGFVSKKPLFRLSKPARLRMRQRSVSPEQIRRTLTQPDRIERDRADPDLLHAIKRFSNQRGSRVLRVIYNPLAVPWKIVTVFFERARRRR